MTGNEDEPGTSEVPVRYPDALFAPLDAVLEARVAATLGDRERARRCVQRAAELLLDLL